MAWFDFLWLEGENENIEHIAEHGLTPEEVEFVFEHYTNVDESDSSGRPMRYGFTPDGRYVAVVFEWLDFMTVYPVTAFEVEVWS